MRDIRSGVGDVPSGLRQDPLMIIAIEQRILRFFPRDVLSPGARREPIRL